MATTARQAMESGLWRGCRTGQQKRDAGERQRLKDHGAQAHVAGRSDVIREDVDECPEDVGDAEGVSGHAQPALGEEADGARDPEDAKENDEPRNRRHERKHRHGVGVRSERLKRTVGAQDVFDAKGDDGEREDPTAGAKQGIHHRLNDAPGLTDERQKRHADAMRFSGSVSGNWGMFPKPNPCYTATVKLSSVRVTAR